MINAIILVDFTDNRCNIVKFEIIHLDCILYNTQGMLLKQKNKITNIS